MRDALRSLRLSPAPAIAAVLTLALAIGMNAGMVGLVDRAILSPPAHVADPGRVVTLAFEQGEGDQRGRMISTSYVTYTAIRDHVKGFSGAAAYQRMSTTLMVDGEQVRADGLMVSGTYFDVLGATARLGRPVQSTDDRPAAEPVIVLSHALWQSAFRGDRAVLGRRVSAGGLDYVVSGVMPPRFSGHSASNVDVWIPFSAAMRQSPGWDQQPFRNVGSVLARLAPGVTAPAAAAEATSAVTYRVVLSPLIGADVNTVDRKVAFWLTGVSALVLVIGLANACTLLLVRASRRRGEFAVRAALGASRGRLLRQAVFEATFVATAATALSLLLASWFDGAIRQVLLPGVTPGDGTGAASALASGLAGLAAAIAAALATASNIPRDLSAGDLDGSSRQSGRRTPVQTGLLVLQTALSVMLLGGAGMFGSSLHKLLSQDFGIRMDGVVVVDTEPGPGSRREDLFDSALDRVRAIPGVRQAAGIAAIPFSGFNVPPISIPGRPRPNIGGQLPFLQAASPEFFDILGIRIVEGRTLSAADEHGAPVVVVNETMAHTVWPNESALGKCIRIGFDPDFDPETATGPPTPGPSVVCREVVGVVRDMRQRSVVPTGSEDHLMQYFVPFAQVPVPPFVPNPDRGAWGLLLLVDGDLSAVAPAVRRAVVGTRTDLPFVRVRPYADLLERQTRPWRLGTTLFALFSGLALAVGAMGLYAAFAHAVVLRRREMAIRLAIGSPPRGLIVLVLREALIVVCAGVMCGWLGVLVGGRSLQALLYDTSAADPAILASAAALMVAVAAAATLVPARSASKADPASLLRG